MAKRAIKTIDDARLAMLELLSSDFTLFVDVHWCDARKAGHWHQTVRMDAAVWLGQREVFRVTAPTAADLYRNFCFQFTQFTKPRRLAKETPRDHSPRAVLRADGRAGFEDEHDGVGGRQRITTIEAKRICGPAN